MLDVPSDYELVAPLDLELAFVMVEQMVASLGSELALQGSE